MIDVVLKPDQIAAERLDGSQVVVFDVLRATSTVVTALANGACEVRLYGEVEETLAARAGIDGKTVLGGERRSVRIDGFDCGNSPAEYSAAMVRGATVLLTTTNGTRAAVAVSAARHILLGSLMNAGATAEALAERATGIDTLLVCAGTDGDYSIEDTIGAGAVLWRLRELAPKLAKSFTDRAWIAHAAFAGARADLAAALRLGHGAANIIRAGCEADIADCARLDARPLVVRVEHAPLRAVVG